MLSKNVGLVDRGGRILIGLVCLYLFFTTSGTWSWAWLLGLIPLATGLFARCPLYSLVGISTCPREDA